MFLIKFFYFLKGYVIIEAYGASVWTLVSACAEEGIKLYNISGGERAQFSIFQDDFYDLYIKAQKLGISLKIKKETGAQKLLYKYKKRIGFVAGIFVSIVFFAVSSCFLWDIKIESNGEIDHEQVRALLKELGIKPGVLLSDIPDGITIKNHLVNSLDNVPWAWMYIDGVRATVNIHEGIIPPVVMDDDAPCDIVASKDGFVTDISAKKGMKAILPGNAVNAGEVLISGLVEVGKDDNKKYYEVHADGDVTAYTRYEESGVYSLFEDRPEFTGRKKSIYNLTLGAKKIQLFSEPEYEYSIKTRKSILSFGFMSLEQIKFLEAEKVSVQLPAEWVIEFAKRDLSARIGERLGKSARLQSEDYIVEESARNITVKAQMEFIENIGVAVPR